MPLPSICHKVKRRLRHQSNPQSLAYMSLTPHNHSPLSFDGCGINGPDAYRTRICTFSKIRGVEAYHYGPMFANAPALLALVELHANQCAEWSSRMALTGNDEEARAYRKDEAIARGLIATATSGKVSS